MKSIIPLVTCCLLMSLTACSSDTDSDIADQDPVWEDQVEALDEAKGVEDMLKKAAEAQSENIQSQTE